MFAREAGQVSGALRATRRPAVSASPDCRAASGRRIPDTVLKPADDRGTLNGPRDWK